LLARPRKLAADLLAKKSEREACRPIANPMNKPYTRIDNDQEFMDVLVSALEERDLAWSPLCLRNPSQTLLFNTL
jgi:hypothetical protein